MSPMVHSDGTWGRGLQSNSVINSDTVPVVTPPREGFCPCKDGEYAAVLMNLGNTCQNEMRAFSWNARGPIVVEVILDELVGAPLAKATPVFGVAKLGWLKML